MVLGIPSLPIPKVENRHIRCENEECTRCTPSRKPRPKQAQLCLQTGIENKGLTAVKNQEMAISQADVSFSMGDSQI